MQTEVEKYHLINKYLKGQLSPAEIVAFEISLEQDVNLNAEVELHRVVNDAIVDNYLIDVKATTQKILSQKAAQNTLRKWGLGLGIVVFVGGIWMLAMKKEELIVVSKTNQFDIKQSKPAKPKLIELNQTASKTIVYHEKKELLIEKTTKPSYLTENVTNEAFVPASIYAKHEIKPVYKEFLTTKSDPIEIVKEPITKPASRETEENEERIQLPEQTTYQPKVQLEETQFILNLSRMEQVKFPVEDDFDGELSIFSEDGVLIFQQTIKSGEPNVWDGINRHGGQASSGQYGFVLKTQEGKIIKHGFVTVVR